MTMINPKIASILGMDELPEEPGREVVEVQPHEIISVDNPDLPAMEDIERKHLQAEKELQEVIDASLKYQRELFDEATTVEPKYRSRYIEVSNGTMHIALDAIKAKLKSQEERKKQRLKEAEFLRPNSSKGGGDEGETTNNFFFGSREELIEIMNDEVKKDEPKD